MTRDQRQAVLDFSKHLDMKTRNNIKDLFERCEDLDIDSIESAKVVAIILGQHAACAAVCMDKTESQFVVMCREHYRQAKETFNAYEKEEDLEGLKKEVREEALN